MVSLEEIEIGTTILGCRFKIDSEQWGAILASDSLKSHIAENREVDILRHRVRFERTKQSINTQFIQSYYDRGLLTTPNNGTVGCKLLKVEFPDAYLLLAFGGHLIIRDYLSDIFEGLSQRPKPRGIWEAVTDTVDQIRAFEQYRINQVLSSAPEQPPEGAGEGFVAISNGEVIKYIQEKGLARTMCVLVRKKLPSKALLEVVIDAKAESSTLKRSNKSPIRDCFPKKAANMERVKQSARILSPAELAEQERRKFLLPPDRIVFINEDLSKAIDEANLKPVIFRLRPDYDDVNKYKVDVLPENKIFDIMGNGEELGKISLNSVFTALSEREKLKNSTLLIFEKDAISKIVEDAFSITHSIQPKEASQNTSNKEADIMYCDNISFHGAERPSRERMKKIREQQQIIAESERNKKAKSDMSSSTEKY